MRSNISSTTVACAIDTFSPFMLIGSPAADWKLTLPPSPTSNTMSPGLVKRRPPPSVEIAGLGILQLSQVLKENAEKKKFDTILLTRQCLAQLQCRVQLPPTTSLATSLLQTDQNSFQFVVLRDCAGFCSAYVCARTHSTTRGGARFISVG